MIGVLSKPSQAVVVNEFFELFKTPWEFYRPGQRYEVVLVTTGEMPDLDAKVILVYSGSPQRFDAALGLAPRRRDSGKTVAYRELAYPIYGDLLSFGTACSGWLCIAAGAEFAGTTVLSSGRRIIRIGYDLFDEIQHLLVTGQPIDCAHIPSLDFHIETLRDLIARTGISIVEVSPAPAGHPLTVCLTHDIDFIGIRQHFLDHSMWGFLYRAIVGATHNYLRGRLSFEQMLQTWECVASLPFVYLGWAKDFWEPFNWYLTAERGLPATYYVIPFKRRPGQNVHGRHSSRRATAYDVRDINNVVERLRNQHCELGVHGIDSWHNADLGREERNVLMSMTGEETTGVRMHWLLNDESTATVLEDAGYAYDSTNGYNETVGFRAGTSQVFRPLNVHTLLELPLHIQDGALFYPRRLDLTEAEADRRCRELITRVKQTGGVLTLLWHDRSHAPERFWGGFYIKLLETLTALGCWFATAADVVRWFRRRREIRFEQTVSGGQMRIRLPGACNPVWPPFRVRVYNPSGADCEQAASLQDVRFREFVWNATGRFEVDLGKLV